MSIFKFKKFNVDQANAPQKIGTDAMVLGALVNPSALGFENPKTILDVGTGCGVIALMLAQQFPSAEITGMDIDEQAVQQAKSNFENADFPNHFESLHQNFLTYNPVEKFDLIVSNPPYFNTKMPSSDEKRSLARHENSMSLQNLIHHSHDLLSENGSLWMIVPSERTDELIAENLDLNLQHRIKIFGKPNKLVRDILVFSKNIALNNNSISELTIRNSMNEYSEQYKELTINFHFNKL
ncbi:tRNA1(Val) (adenine(37)-N6)-methyltransferase [Brumimicrobium mesophilum]|uniref:tRNA1(Val) (adenine(37)-N6)-methyltransferase n=1 Tax=Brumimicrobium mesophilum TaxID=392717 RepID=UPI000D140B6A|nr:methyltransferase [Brumimicrobium mesophilum]